ncbi:carboxypeptidase D isoform X3 [Sitodiplosis mosellana]|uniref:carboxypeptidase D isoform X3 n=1 Tax=Sitodiplosis mosellana TaxID=263140 RepID=UPI002443CD87|nr:carboxypeptidase D isoform X3 [Sitodiplosis mosellana]
MAFTQSFGTLAAAVTLCLFVVNLNIETCSSQQLNQLNDYSGSRPYTPDPGLLDFVYHNHEDMTRFLRATSARYPNLTALYSIGKSVQGRDLWVMVVSASPYEHMIGKPDVKYIGNIHGNEPVGKEMLLHLIQYLVSSYSTDPYIRWLLDNTRVHFLPSMNPDGYAVSKEGTCDGAQGRYNSRGFDLNRNFPDYFKPNTKREQPETDAVKDWISKIQFVLSGSLHGGALVASYPYDNTPSSMFQNYASQPSLTPDDDVFKHLSLTYANNHAKMSRGVACKSATPQFEQGITNGAAWYPLTGGMQDYNYVWHGCMEVTLEVSCCKFPPAHELRKYWDDNQLSMIKFLAEAHRGVQGFVTDGNGLPIERASLKIKGRDVGFQTTRYGEFWRILLPGIYKLEVYADGFAPREIDFMVVEQHPTLLNVTLQGSKENGKLKPRLGIKKAYQLAKLNPVDTRIFRNDGPYYRPIHASQNQMYRPPPQHLANDQSFMGSIQTGFSTLLNNLFG